MKKEYNQLLKRIERIENALREFNESLRYSFCDHEKEEIIKYPKEEIVNPDYPYLLKEDTTLHFYRCKKCGISLSKEGKVITQRV